MAGTRGILAAFAIGSAIISLPAAAQSGSSSSLTHTVSVTVPPRVKVQVASLSVATPGMVRNANGRVKTDGVALAVQASRAWVLTVGSASKSNLQWSSDSSSGFSTVGNTHVAVANGVQSSATLDANLFFRNGTLGRPQSEAIILTVAAP